ncbi:MAG: tripartite tricarboxylate transporter substrate binding protein [Rhodopseudomonas sp.]|nr:tripartite tricarboxylate transporter substrate binding protein [Rhodopseudomonas sp.]
MLKRLLAIALLTAVTPATVPAWAQSDYPNHPITLVVPFGAGSGTDSMARELAQQLSANLGQTVVVENKPGASGIIATEYAARAKPDGYTLLMAGNTTHSANPYLFKKLPYDPIKDFTPIARLATAPFVLVVSSKGPYKTIADVVAAAKAKPGTMTYGAPSSAAIVAGETMKQVAGVTVTQVRYKQTPQAMTDVMGQITSMAFVDLAAALTNIKADNLRALVTTGPERTPLLPNVPTMAESGFPGTNIIAWVGVFAPAHIPADVRSKLDAAVKQLMSTAKIQNRLTLMGLDPAYMASTETDAFVKTELTRWGGMIHKADIKPQ